MHSSAISPKTKQKKNICVKKGLSSPSGGRAYNAHQDGINFSFTFWATDWIRFSLILYTRKNDSVYCHGDKVFSGLDKHEEQKIKKHLGRWTGEILSKQLWGSAKRALSDRAFSEAVREMEGWDEERRSGMRLEDILGKVCISLSLSGAQLGTNTTQHWEEGRSRTRTLMQECFSPNSKRSSLLSAFSSPPSVLQPTLLQLEKQTIFCMNFQYQYHS